MRHIPTALAARIESGAVGLCHAWVVTRADGARLGFTDHDGALSVEGVVCSAASGWTGGVAEGAVGLTAGDASAVGVLDDITLEDGVVSEVDIVAGLYDGARVEVWRLDWSAPELRVRIWAGAIGRIDRRGDLLGRYRPSGYLSGSFTAEMEGPLARLERVVGRSYGRTCDALLGDGRCRVDLAGFPGASCDKRWETCVGTFANGLNFQGFPDIPGDDYLTAFPAEGGRHDGGSRR